MSEWELVCDRTSDHGEAGLMTVSPDTGEAGLMTVSPDTGEAMTEGCPCETCDPFGDLRRRSQMPDIRDVEEFPAPAPAELVATQGARGRTEQKAVTPVCWFHDHGVHVFPTYNKKPAVPEGTSQFDYRCSREQAAGFKEYGAPGGVREGYDDGLTIVDTDEDDDETWVVAHLPDTPFKVRTSQGWHRYFRTRGPLPSYIHRDKRSIENRNRGLYVVGPGSVRPDGVVYTASAWSWRWEDIPFFPDGFLFNDGSCGRISPERTGTPGEEYEFPEAVYKNLRHRELFRLLRSCKGSGIDREATYELVTMANANRCHPPLDVDEEFEEWFARAWNNRDRPFLPAVLHGLRGL